MHTEASAASRSAARDATEVICSRGVLTGCAPAYPAHAGLGVRFEDGDGDGVPECVSYSDGEAPARAEARCGLLESRQEGARTLSLPVMATTDIDSNGRWTAAACPPPFVLSACGCFSEHGNCLGAGVTRVRPDPAAETLVDVCNVTQTVPKAWWRAGAEAHALCFWFGEASELLAVDRASTACATAPATGSHALPDKAWLPERWREQLRVSEDAGSSADRQSFATRQRRTELGSGFVLGVLFCATLALTAAVVFTCVRMRKRARLGGAPTMLAPVALVMPSGATPTAQPAGRAVGGVSAAAPTLGYAAPNVPMNAPLVASDSAQVNAGSHV